jgi:hypothetical protein
MEMAAALGFLPGWRKFRKFGMNPAVVSSSTQEMWPNGTARVLPTTSTVAAVVSSSVEDDILTAGEVAGTGAWTVTVEGLDDDGIEVSETVTMNGAAAVNTTQVFSRINRAYNTTAGTGKVNAGNISISLDSGKLQAYIAANQGQTHQTNYTVPAGHTLLVTGLTLGVGRMSGATDLAIYSQARLDGITGSDASWRSLSAIYLWNGGRHQNVATATVVPASTEIRQQIVSDTTTQAYGIYQGFLIDNDVLP